MSPPEMALACPVCGSDDVITAGSAPPMCQEHSGKGEASNPKYDPSLCYWCQRAEVDIPGHWCGRCLEGAPLASDETPSGSVAGTSPEAVGPATLADRFRTALIRGDDVLSIPPPEPLIADLLDLDSLAVLYGPSGSGKTFVALDWTLSVGTGSWWFGREVTSGPVLYVAAEGVGGLGIRVRAWQEHRNTQTSGKVTWLPLAVNLLDRHAAAALLDIASELNPRLVVFDTLARCMVGGDENTAKDMGLAVEAADSVRRATGGCVLVVHHTGKEVGAGARGSSALKGAVNTELECSSEGTTVTIKVSKQKEDTGGQVIRLSRVQVGDSCALDSHRGEADLADKALDLLAELVAIDTGDGVSSSTWKRSSGVADRSFYRWQKSLLEQGYCHKAGAKSHARFTVSEQGKQALEDR